MRVRAVVFVLFVAVSAFGMVAAAVPAGTGVGVGATGAAAGPADAAVGAGPAGAAANEAGAGGGATNNSSMGGQLSSFMESSAGETDASVDSEIWAAGEGRNGSADARVTRTERRLAQLRDRKERIERAYRNGTLPEQAYRAQMSNLVGQLAALNRSVERLAARGADPGSVAQLREDVRNVSGGGVSEVGRSMAGGPPEDLPAAAGNASRPGNGSGNGNGGAGRGGDGGNGEGNGDGDGGNGKGNGDGDGGNGEGNGSGEGEGGEGKGNGDGDGDEGKGNGSGEGGEGGRGNGSGDGRGNGSDDDTDGGTGAGEGD